MSDDQDQPPIYRQLLFAGSDASDHTITIALGTGAESGVRVDIAASLVGPLVAAIMAEAYKLNEVMTEDERSNASSLNANGVFVSQIGGKPAIVFELSNGSLLPLVIESAENLAGFAAELALMAKSPSGPAH